MSDPLDDLETDEEYEERRSKEAAKIPAVKPNDPRVVHVAFDENGNAKTTQSLLGKARVQAMRKARRTP